MTSKLLIVLILLVGTLVAGCVTNSYEYQIISYQRNGDSYNVEYLYNGTPTFKGIVTLPNNTIQYKEVSDIRPSWDSFPHFIMNDSFGTLYIPINKTVVRQ